MADRDLHSGDQAFAAVLASLQREVRLLRSRAARPGAVRYDDKDPMMAGFTSLSNNSLVTLNELHLDPGVWALFARGETSIDRSVFTGTEAVNAWINVIPSSGGVTRVATSSNGPFTTPSPFGGGRYSTTWSIWTVHHSDDVCTVVHQGNVGDWSSSSHTVTWERAALMALPM